MPFRALVSTPSPTSSKSLDLSHCYLLEDSGLVEVIEATPWLQHLSVAGCFRVSDIGAVQLSRMRQLTYLSLNYCKITDRTLEAIAALPVLRELDLSSCNRITAQGIFGLAAVNSRRGLEVLDLENCSVLKTLPRKGPWVRKRVEPIFRLVGPDAVNPLCL